MNNNKILTEQQLFDRAYELLKKKNEKKAQIRPIKPIIENQGIRTQIVNGADFCESIRRNIDDVVNFCVSELSTKATLPLNGSILFAHRIRPNRMFTALQRYIEQNVKCSECKSLNTNIK